MKTVVLRLDIHDDEGRNKAMKIVCGLGGVKSIAINPKYGKLTVTGDVDPVVVVSKLRKICYADIVSVGLGDLKDEYAAWFRND